MKIIRNHTEPLYEQNDIQLGNNILEAAGSQDGSNLEIQLSVAEEDELKSRYCQPISECLKSVIAKAVWRRFNRKFTARVAYFSDSRTFKTFESA